MIPILPSNPNTISKPVYSLQEQLERLRRLDTHERRITPERELEKVKLEGLLEKS
jgi:hypothetical protein